MINKENFNNLGEIKRKHGKGTNIGFDVWIDISNFFQGKLRLFKKLQKKSQWLSTDYSIYKALIKEFNSIIEGI